MFEFGNLSGSKVAPSFVKPQILYADLTAILFSESLTGISNSLAKFFINCDLSVLFFEDSSDKFNSGIPSFEVLISIGISFLILRPWMSPHVMYGSARCES